MSVSRIIAVALFFFACLATSTVRAELIVNGFDTNLHDRFSNDASFIGNAYDWSGVGRNGRWATMISDSFFLSARHYAPANGSSLTFFHSNDPGGSSEAHTVAEGWVMQDSDLWLGRLTTGVSDSVAKYAVADISPAAAVSMDVTTFGVSTGFAAAANQRVGRNEVDAVLPDFSSAGLTGTADVFVYDFDTVGGVGADEARVTTGDSGAPTFLLTDSGPAILGVHWFRYVEVDGLGGFGSGDTFVPTYIDDISARMALFNESLTVVSVPEPSHALLLCCLFAVCVILRRRGRASCSTE